MAARERGGVSAANSGGAPFSDRELRSFPYARSADGDDRSFAGVVTVIGKCRKAYDLLAPIYDRATDGFDTTDLKDTEALLDERG